MKRLPDPDSPLSPPLCTGPDFTVESRLIHGGAHCVAGVDEAGRGPLAGPVVAAAVILDPENIPDGLDDSKKLTAMRRLVLFERIMRDAVAGFAIVPAAVIDRINIRQSSLLAMERSVRALPQQPDATIVDGRDCPPGLPGNSAALVGGDAISASIAAASIVAKVIRDRQMERAAVLYPQYGFEKHKGYGTTMHMASLVRHGVCPLHRRSFAPVRRICES